MGFGMFINGAMQGDTLGEVGRQRAGQGSFDPIAHDSTHDQGGRVTCK
jgi:hypothetical protein